MEELNKNEISDSLIRDHLAVKRTVMANERTLLAYIRTSLALMITGVSAIHFLKSYWAYIAGAAIIVSGIIILMVGITRFAKMESALKK